MAIRQFHHGAAGFFYSEKDGGQGFVMEKSCAYKKEILAGARMKSASQVKSNPSRLPHSGFHRVSDFIHGSGFHPAPGTDLTEKKKPDAKKHRASFFWSG